MSGGTALDLTLVRLLVRNGEAKTIRQSAGLSLHEAAREIGTHAATIRRWEIGERVPHGELALRYGALLAELAQATRSGE